MSGVELYLILKFIIIVLDLTSCRVLEGQINFTFDTRSLLM